MQEDIKKYDLYSNVTKWKILLLKYGVKFEPLNLFNSYPSIREYKTKSRSLYVITKNFEVYDKSKDKSLIPSEIVLKDKQQKSLVKLRYSENSPIELKIIENKIYFFIDDVKQDIDVELVKKHEILNKKLKNGLNCVGDYIDIVGIDRISILFFEGCYNWLSGKPCKFCDLHSQKEEHITYKPTLNNLKKFDFNVMKWWNNIKKEYLENMTEALNLVLKEKNMQHKHIFFMSGNLKTNTDVWNIVEETIRYVTQKINLSEYDTYLNVAPHDKIERLLAIKEMKIKYIQYNLEIVDEENFNYTCPGKLKYKEFLYKLREAVNYYGKGYVRSNFVLGLDDMDKTLEFAKKIAKEGIVFDYSVFQPKKNTVYYNKKTPDFDEVILFTRELVNLYKRYNFKPIFCSLSSRSSIVNELYEEKVKEKSICK